MTPARGSAAFFAVRSAWACPCFCALLLSVIKGCHVQAGRSLDLELKTFETSACLNMISALRVPKHMTEIDHES